MSKKILVTGASGYIALHVVNMLVKQGHQVRGTVRNLNDLDKVEPLKRLGPIELYQADLLDAESWIKPCEGVDIVLHIASPLPVTAPSDENLVIRPAVEGTLNVFNAALNANVERVVFTSSGLCISGYEYKAKTFNENDWVDIEDAKTAYQKSKILAEKAAWKFFNEKKKKNEKCFELAVIVPTFVLGPVLSAASGSSVTKFSRIFDPNLKKIDEMYAATCDVRDVAMAHVKAALEDKAIGHRNLITSGKHLFSISNWIDILKMEFGDYKFPEVVINQEKAQTIQKTVFDNSRMINILGIEPIDFKSTILDMTNSLIEQGIIDKL